MAGFCDLFEPWGGGTDALKKKTLIAALLFLTALLTGCAMKTVEQMYCPPRRSEELSNLQSAIDREMSGLEYAAPVSGENQQTVQMADLDGDGQEEYLVFAKGVSEKPLKILIFCQEEDDSCALMETVELSGTSFEQVEYVDMDGVPGQEIVVGVQLSDRMLRIGSVYSFASGEGSCILSTVYARMLTTDLDGNGRRELMVIRSGETEADNAVAMLFQWKSEGMDRSKEVMLSEKADHIKRVTPGTLEDGKAAVFIASTVNENAIVTDIFTVGRGTFYNLSLYGESGASVQTLRDYYIYAEDIDEDGVLELPSLLPMKNTSTVAGTVRQHLIRWYSVDQEGNQKDKRYTFHNYSGGWYLELDSSWISRIAVEQDDNTYTFYIWDEELGEAQPLFSVYSLTGKDRDSEAGTGNRFALYRGENVVYAAKLESTSALYGITEEYLTSRFHLIRRDWIAGET